MSDPITTLGQLLDSSAQRDAIHIAIAPVVAAEFLRVGQSIALDSAGKATGEGAAIGIVDPFLKMPVEPGERFWMFLLPNTVTGMRHHWSHPTFAEQVHVPPAPQSTDKKLPRRVASYFTPPEFPPIETENAALVAADYWEEHGEPRRAAMLRDIPGSQEKSVEWLTGFAAQFDMSYGALIQAARDYITSGDYVTLDYDTPDRVWRDREELWRHFEIATGDQVPDADRESTFFTCAC